MKSLRAPFMTAWISRNSLSLIIFIVPFAFTVAVGAAFLRSYWNNFDYYGTRIINRLVEETQQLEPQLLERLSGANRCDIGVDILQKPVNITDLELADCKTEKTVDSAPTIEQCAMSMPGSSLMRLHCSSLNRKIARHNGTAANKVSLTGVGLQYAFISGNGLRLNATRSYQSIFENWQNYGDAQFKAFIFPFTALIAVSLLLYFLVIRRISILSREARRAVKERHSNFIPDGHGNKDEIGTLARYLRVLLKQGTRQTRRLKISNGELQRQNESLRRVRKMVGHEIYTPLQNLQGILAGNLRGLTQVNRIRRATDAILSEGTVSTRTKPLDVAAFLTAWSGNIAKERDIDCLRYIGPDSGIQGLADEEQLEDALDHIVNNALDFRTPNSPITVELAPNAESLTLFVRNYGPLIEEDALERILDYGVSLRATPGDAHLGQGLYQAHQYLTAMGGMLKARNLPPNQVEFVLKLSVS